VMEWFQRLLPREDKFFDLFEAHAATLIAGAEALRRMLDGGAQMPGFCQAVVEREGEADVIAAEVMDSVRRTFITPFDRSDIQELIQAMDDSIDQMNQTAKTVALFEVREFDPLMQEMADLAIEAAKLTAEVMPLLREIAKHAAAINSYVAAVKALEERSDTMHDDGLRSLFRRHRDGNAMNFVIGSEIYDHLEKVLDRFESVANQVNAIVIEHL
jgi:predicted phosphate transport protein (TIGR00153 family)